MHPTAMLQRLLIACLSSWTLLACQMIETQPVNSVQELIPRETRIDGSKVSYLTNGFDRRAVVMIHGWGCNGNFWKNQVGELSKHGRVVVIDLPGHGASDAPQIDYTVDHFAFAVQCVLKDAGIERATLVGHSMGAAVALAVYRQAPERVEGLIAVDGALRSYDVPEDRKQQLLASFSGPDWAKTLREFVTSTVPGGANSQVVDWVIAQAQRTPQRVLVSAMDGLMSYQGWSDEKIRCPIAIIDAPGPMWTDDYKSKVRAMAPQVKWTTLEGCGHFPMLEKPEEFGAALMTAVEHVQRRI